MLARKAVRKGFTLVEILIVVVILGILAAIVIPQFTSASQSAKRSSLISQLQTIRSQLELGQIQHNGAYPDLVTDQWAPLTTETEPDAAYTTGDGSGNEMGPYLQQPPVNPFSTLDNPAEVALNNTKAWRYILATGAIHAVVPAAKMEELRISDADAIAAR
jgi:general secretion pathway protein G